MPSLRDFDARFYNGFYDRHGTIEPSEYCCKTTDLAFEHDQISAVWDVRKRLAHVFLLPNVPTIYSFMSVQHRSVR